MNNADPYMGNTPKWQKVQYQMFCFIYNSICIDEVVIK